MAKLGTRILRLGAFGAVAFAITGAVLLRSMPEVRAAVLGQYDEGPQPAKLQIGVTVDKELVGGGFDQPLHVTHAGDSSGRQFVVEQPGLIWILKDGKKSAQPFIDLRSVVGSNGSERGLLSVAFHPEYESNGQFFVYYTDKKGAIVVARYNVSKSNPDQGDSLTGKILIVQEKPYANHNGGLALFGPDGYLYIGTGDGGAAGDPLDAGQNVDILLGKILRIDVNKTEGSLAYGIPADNPFATTNQGQTRAVWAYGVRNPWRFSFDRATGDLYIADVGQNLYEEINYWKAGSPSGVNYGWDTMEGFHCFADGAGCNQQGLQLPILEYNHRLGNSVTGGNVYRGSLYPALQGLYFYADFGTGRVWAARAGANGVWENDEVMNAEAAVSSFGEDEAGELYFADYGGGNIYRVIAK